MATATTLNPDLEADRLISVKDAAEMTGTSYHTIYRLIKAGRLRECRVGHALRIRLRDLNRYVMGDEPDF